MIRGIAAIYNRHEYRAGQRAALLAWGDRLRAIVGAPTSGSEALPAADVAGEWGGTARAHSEPLSAARAAV